MDYTVTHIKLRLPCKSRGDQFHLTDGILNQISKTRYT